MLRIKNAGQHKKLCKENIAQASDVSLDCILDLLEKNTLLRKSANKNNKSR